MSQKTPRTSELSLVRRTVLLIQDSTMTSFTRHWISIGEIHDLTNKPPIPNKRTFCVRTMDLSDPIVGALLAAAAVQQQQPQPSLINNPLLNFHSAAAAPTTNNNMPAMRT